MVFSDRSRQNHADHVRRKYRFTSSPHSQSAHGEEKEEKVLGFEFGDAPAVFLEEPWRKKGQRDEDHDGNYHKDQRLDCERGKDQSKRNHGSKIIDEAGGQNGFAIFGDVEAQFQHHRIDNRN